jgi:hypothetical protein
LYVFLGTVLARAVLVWLFPFVWAIAFFWYGRWSPRCDSTYFGGILGTVLSGQLLFGCYLLVVIGKYSLSRATLVWLCPFVWAIAFFWYGRWSPRCDSTYIGGILGIVL